MPIQFVEIERVTLVSTRTQTTRSYWAAVRIAVLSRLGALSVRRRSRQSAGALKGRAQKLESEGYL